MQDHTTTEKPNSTDDIDFRKFTARDGQQYKLSLKQMRFAEAYLLHGKAYQAVIDAGYNVYEVDKNGHKTLKFDMCRSLASDNLTKPSILKYIDLKLNAAGLNDETVARQHLFVIQQMEDLSAKNVAMSMYYKRYNKYPKETVEIEAGEKLAESLDKIAHILPK
jgi:phage terminase small subunit